MTADVWLPDNINSMAVPDHVSSCWKRNQEYRRSLCNEFVIQVTCQFDPLRPNGLGLSCPNQPGATSYMVRRRSQRVLARDSDRFLAQIVH